MFFLDDVNAAKADQQGCKPLLSIQDQRQIRDAIRIGELIVSPALLCLLNEFVNLPLIAVLRL